MWSRSPPKIIDKAVRSKLEPLNPEPRNSPNFYLYCDVENYTPHQPNHLKYLTFLSAFGICRYLTIRNHHRA